MDEEKESLLEWMKKYILKGPENNGETPDELKGQGHSFDSNNMLSSGRGNSGGIGGDVCTCNPRRSQCPPGGCAMDWFWKSLGM